MVGRVLRSHVVVALVCAWGAACKPSHHAPAVPAPDVPGPAESCVDGAQACIARAAELVAQGRRVEAIALLRDGCVTRDEPAVCSALARLYLDERVGARDARASAEAGERALAGWARRCQAEDWDACVRYGRDADHLARNAKAAFEAYDLACAHDHAEGCAEAGTFAQDGAGMARSRAQAMRYYERACALRGAKGCFYLGLALQDGQGADVGADEARAVDVFAVACALGELRACNNHGLALSHGRGVPRDEAGALKVFIAACDAGHGRACHNTAVAFEQGTGVAIDLRAAFSYYTRGCERDAGEACQRRAYFLEEGIGVPADLAAALTVYTKACELDEPRGCFDVGRFYVNGKVGPVDDILGARYLDKSCAMKEVDGCRGIAYAYLSGRGMVRDNAKAAAAYLVACELGDWPSCGDAGQVQWLADSVKAVEPTGPLVRHCESDTEGFRRSCRLIAFEHLFGESVASVVDPARALPFAERACLAPTISGEERDPAADVADCENALKALAAVPQAAGDKERRARLDKALEAARAALRP